MDLFTHNVQNAKMDIGLKIATVFQIDVNSLILTIIFAINVILNMNSGLFLGK